MALSQTRQNLIALIRQIPYFSEASEASLITLVNLGYRRTVEVGEFICREGDIGNSFSIILAGCVEVISVQKRQVLGILKQGDFFGEIAVLTGTRRMASVRAASEVKLFVIHRDHLRTLLIEHQALAEQIAIKLTERELMLVGLGVLEQPNDQNSLALLQNRICTVFGL